ncbi:MAG: HEPN domain-containing protein [bacterium]
MKEITKEWVRLATADMMSAKHLLTLYPLSLEVICYLCSQCSEKMLKAFLVENEQAPPRIHDLTHLNKLCVEINEKFEFLNDQCTNLMPYGVHVRYPNNLELIEDDMRLAIIDAENIFNFVSNILK